jgi:hypothetical protein
MLVELIPNESIVVFEIAYQLEAVTYWLSFP